VKNEHVLGLVNGVVEARLARQNVIHQSGLSHRLVVDDLQLDARACVVPVVENVALLYRALAVQELPWPGR